MFLQRPFCVCVMSDSDPIDFSHSHALLSMRFFQQEYCSRLPFTPPGDLPNPGIKPKSPVSPALAGRFFATEPPEKPFVPI